MYLSSKGAESTCKVVSSITIQRKCIRVSGKAWLYNMLISGRYAAKEG
jgi:hypothetical protein